MPPPPAWSMRSSGPLRDGSLIPAVDLLGVRVHRVTLPDAAHAILDFVRSGEARQVVTLNGAMLARAAADPDLRAIVNRAALVTADGAGVLLAGRILGVRLPERVAGIDLVERVCAEGAARSLRVFLLGAAPGVAAAAADALVKRHRGLSVVGTQHGYFASHDDGAVVSRIREARPEMVLVALGFPRQEQWIAAHLAELPGMVCLGVGGTLDVLAGRTRRAPLWMRRAGLEWLYRLVREPRRWRAAVALPKLFAMAVTHRVLKGKKELHSGS